MNENQPVYINDLSDEEKHILQLAQKLKGMDKDPIKILKFFIETSATVDKIFDYGKGAKNFLQEQWEAFSKEYHKK